MPEAGHVVDCNKAKTQAQVKLKGSRLVQEAWLSGPNALNRSIELHPSFLTLRLKLQQEDNRRIPPRNNSDRQWKFFSRAGPEGRACGVRAWAIAIVPSGGRLSGSPRRGCNRDPDS